MKKITNTLLKEEYYFKKLDNGMHVYLYPKLDFHRTYAIFRTKFGSFDLEFYDPKTNELIVTPPGVAHFLEHKMFESPDGSDIVEVFSRIGGDSNAFTTYDNTAYLVTTSENELENIKTLIDFVQTPYFTDENIEKEKPIIEQEIRMYLDKASTSLYNHLLQNMYQKNNVRHDIGGTLESIYDINKDILYKCYNTFYHPSNMTLTIIGNFDKESVMKMIEENQLEKNYQVATQIKRNYHIEDEHVVAADTSSYMDISTPKVGCGVKFNVSGYDYKEIYKNMILLDILSDIFFDESSDFYHRLIESEIINNSFVYDPYFEPTYGHIAFTVDTLKVEEFKEEIKKEILKIKTAEISESTFNRYKKVVLANSIARFNYLESIANLIADLDAVDLDLFETLEIKNNITVQDLKHVQDMIKEEAITFHTIYPKKIK